MRRTLLVVLRVTTALTAPALAGSAAPPPPGFASDNVEWLGNVPLHADTAGAHLLDGYLYVTSSTQLSIYDARIAESPRGWPATGATRFPADQAPSTTSPRWRQASC